jgi:hypothetical protein
MVIIFRVSVVVFITPREVIMQECKIKKYCSKNKITEYDKTSILNENIKLETCSNCIYFCSKNCRTGMPTVE